MPEAVPDLPLIDSGANESRTHVLLVGSLLGDSAVVVPLFCGNNCKTLPPLCGTLGTSQRLFWVE